MGPDAARAGAAPRHHEDTDIAIGAADLGAIREVMRDWHLWEANDGALKPLLPGVPLTPGCEQLWGRRGAGQPWRFELLLDRQSTEAEWVYKRDARVRLPWQRAAHEVGGVDARPPRPARVGAAHPARRSSRRRRRRWRNRGN